jgi:signal transduction histidine kinase
MDGPARVWVQRTGGLVEVTVDDDGSGIRSPTEAVFTAFYRAQSSRNHSTGGTGLGLAIALETMARQHDSTIEIAVAPSGGARLRVVRAL